MTGEKEIQITRGSKDIQQSSFHKSIEISHTGRPISDIIPELLELEIRCGRTRKNFRVLLEERQAMKGYRYKLAQILKTGGPSHGPTVSTRKLKKQEINIDEIKDIATLKCPHCRGGKSALIKCGCGGLSCGGGVRIENHREYHECPWCRSVGIIGGKIETLSGEKSHSHLGLAASKNDNKQFLRSAIANVKSLPSSNKKMLKG